jgi:hypothetical protein
MRGLRPRAPAKNAGAQPVTPLECLRSLRLRAHCDACGTTPDVLHSPLSLRGFYCPAHCPVCGVRPATTAALSAGQLQGSAE